MSRIGISGTRRVLRDRTTRTVVALVALAACAVGAADASAGLTVDSVTFSKTGTAGIVEPNDVVTVTATMSWPEASALRLVGNPWGVKWFSCAIPATAVAANVSENGSSDPCSGGSTQTYDESDPGVTVTRPNPLPQNAGDPLTIVTTYAIKSGDRGKIVVPMFGITDTSNRSAGKAWSGQIPVVASSAGSAPSFYANPQSASVAAGATKTFSAEISSLTAITGATDRVTYQWEHKSAGGSWAATGTPRTVINPSTQADRSDSLTTPTLTLADDQSRYRLVAMRGPTVSGQGIGTDQTTAWPLWPSSASTTSNEATITMIQGPAIPLKPTIQMTGSGQVTVEVVPGSGGASVSNYKVIAVEDRTKTATCSPGAVISCVVSNLSNGTAYTFVAQAFGNGVWSADSPASDAATPDIAPTAPLAPTVVAGDGSVTVSVQRGSGGGVPFKIIARAFDATGQTFLQKSCEVYGASGSCQITGLTNGVTYTFKAAALPGFLNSPLSDPVTPSASAGGGGGGGSSDTAGGGTSPGGGATGGTSTRTGAEAPSPAGSVNTTRVPLALPEQVRTAPGAKVVVDPFLNDAPSAGATPDRGSVQVRDPRSGGWSRSVTVSGEGTWTVDPTTGRITYTPTTGFAGPTTPLEYRYRDSSGQTASSTITATVRSGGGAAPLTVGGMMGEPLVVSPLAALPGGAGAWKPSTLQIRDPRTGRWGMTATVAGQGTYVADPATGAIRFTPKPGFHGIATPLAYRVTSSKGQRTTSAISPVIRTLAAMLVSEADIPAKVVRVGERLRVTVTVRNIGGAASDPTTIDTELPNGLVSEDETLVRAAALQLSWRIGSLAPGQLTRRTLLLRVVEDGPVAIGVRVAGATATGSSSSASVRVLPAKGRPEPVTG